MFFIPSPTKLLVAGGSALALAGGSFYAGHHLATIQEQATQARYAKSAREQYDKLASDYNTQANLLEEAKAQRIIVYKTITKRVDRFINRPIYKTACIDADGVSAANQALTNGQIPQTEVKDVSP